jgi:hypothetical protein
MLQGGKGMNRRGVLGVCLLALLLAVNSVAAGPVSSGPQAGEKVPGPFAPLNITGPEAGKKSCQYCKNGSRPVIVIFAREVSPAVVGLLKKIDSATAANRERGMASYIVFCSDDGGMAGQLQDLARRENIQHTIITLYKAGGPERYRLAAEADITVLLYNHFTVRANHAFPKGEWTDAATNAVVADITKILSEQ